ncbi:hypothetical protein KDA23_06950, partial [Candidatus Saccharibacteria bacterium]|nr:hypothetical protein [Candidatus Saccharibacteria bacterium]
MRTLRYIKTTFIIALLLFSVISGIIAPKTAHADVISGEIAPKVEQFLYYWGLVSCFARNDVDQASPSQVASGDWFDNNIGQGHGYFGYLGDDNGEIGCDHADMVQQAVPAVWGTKSGEASDGVFFRAWCSVQPYAERTDSDDKETLQGCLTGSGNYDFSGYNSSEITAALHDGVASSSASGSSFPFTTSQLGEPGQYYLYKQSLEQLCGKVDSRPNNGSDPILQDENWVSVWEVDLATGEITKNIWQIKSNENDAKSVWAVEHSKTVTDPYPYTGKKVKCEDMAAYTRQYAAAFADSVKLYNKEHPDDAGTSGSTSSSDTGEIDVSCGQTLDFPGFIFPVTSVLNWLFCGFIAATNTASQQLDEQLLKMLCVDQASLFGTASMCPKQATNSDQTSAAYKKVWDVFRVLSLGLLVIVGLIMVLSQTIGLEVFDAYTIRKTLPRLIVAAIGITLSWQLMDFFVGLTNALGLGVRALIYAPFNQAGITNVNVLTGGTPAITVLFAMGGFLVLGALGVLSLLGTALLSIFVAFVVLVLRNIVVIMLTVIAPLAIVAYILPNTQKWWSNWWDWWSKALLMFPIIVGFIAIGHVFAAIAAKQSDSTLSAIIAFLAYFAPYFLLPLTFRFAGGVLATLGGFTNDRGRGVFDRLKGFRANQAQKNIQAMGEGNRFRGSGAFSRGFNATTRGIAGFAAADKGYNPRYWGSATQSHLSNQSLVHAAEYGEKNEAFQAVKGNDDLLLAGLRHRNDYAAIEADLRAKGYSEDAARQGAAAVRLARRDTSDEVFETAAAMALPATGTAFKGGAGEMHTLINEVAGSDRQKASRMLAAMRSGAAGARRYDLGGGSYASQLGVMEDQYNGTVTEAAANRTIAEQSLEGQGGGYVAGARNGAVK